MTNDVYLSKTITDATLMFRDFRGLGSKYIPRGIRSFAMVLDLEQALSLPDEGWIVKYPRVSEAGHLPTLRVWLPKDFDIRNISLNGEPFYAGDDLSVLDLSEKLTGTVSITGQPWNVRGQYGVKNHLVSLDAKS